MVDYTRLKISQDEDSIYWTCEMELTNPDDSALFPLDEPFSINFYGRTFSFVSDGRQRSMAMVEENGQPTIRYSATVRGASPLILQSSTRATTVTYELTANRLARLVVQDLIGPIDWQLLEWSIPAFRFAVEGISPVEAARQVVEAVGGVILCDPDGTVVCKPRYPVRVPDYVTATPVLEVSGGAVHQWDERGFTPGRWDVITVRDVDPDDRADTVEFIKDPTNPLRGTLRAYPSPWRTSLNLTSSRNGVTTTGGSAVLRTEDEEKVEFLNGRATMKYPVYSITSVDWLDDSLGSVSFDQYSRELRSNNDGYSYAAITYRVRSVNFTVTANAAKDTQLRLVDTSAQS